MKIELRYRNLEVKRFGESSGSVNINNNSTLTSVERVEDKVSVNFVFSTNYDPGIGVIRIEGNLSFSDTEENMNRAMDEWKKSGGKNLPVDLAEKVHNTILSNCVVQATLLSKEVQLPPPIPMPNVSIGKKEDRTEVKGETSSYIR
ncbi:MAG: hypothetical protein L6243_05610 [Candidatus Altiarchaeales archaeon]|nr:hypothetical protein [Candidatus Altiarchaeota archaeon]MBU4266161.1 hypothetical protein [Candidatus Altiarchaeota archaeon]MBU4342333.1 hypothetical protein [Candidatus Altiarchaeota archaeon]MBU4437067.1 hypothetical protein [Candidatus Altiarchaeota archaeon]MCG2783047.1 hypothetical protein [Candidatus Altiarchaeales archaeon]